jgi:hypothetical protein
MKNRKFISATLLVFLVASYSLLTTACSPPTTSFKDRTGIDLAKTAGGGVGGGTIDEDGHYRLDAGGDSYADAPKVAPTLNDFLFACEKGAEVWSKGQVDYPKQLKLNTGDVTSYVAAIDVRPNPNLPSEVIQDPSATSQPVAVRCRVAARLVSTGDGLEINPGQGLWLDRTFTPSGVINWAWTVKATQGRSQDLRLELLPAVVDEQGQVMVSGKESNLASFVTHVEVDAPTSDDIKQWFEKTWVGVSAAAAAIAAALIALVKFSGDIGQAYREARAKCMGMRPRRRSETATARARRKNRQPSSK